MAFGAVDEFEEVKTRKKKLNENRIKMIRD